jgi:hypothetical protein
MPGLPLNASRHPLVQKNYTDLHFLNRSSFDPAAPPLMFTRAPAAAVTMQVTTALLTHDACDRLQLRS